jgi:hypothetical protein
VNFPFPAPAYIVYVSLFLVGFMLLNLQFSV